MKSLLVLILATGMTQLYAQQEVDPDHFDQPASKAAVQKVHVSHASAHQRNHQNLASNNRAHQHHTRTAA